MRRTFGDLHRLYTGQVNARNQWAGRLWQARFGSMAMDEDHLTAAIRHVSHNPMRARLVDRAEDWPWSSVGAHLRRQDDGVVTTAPVLARVGPFADFLAAAFGEAGAFAALRRSETTGRPLGSDDWIERREQAFARPLAPRRSGPKPREAQPTPQHDLFGKLATVTRTAIPVGRTSDARSRSWTWQTALCARPGQTGARGNRPRRAARPRFAPTRI